LNQKKQPIPIANINTPRPNVTHGLCFSDSDMDKFLREKVLSKRREQERVTPGLAVSRNAKQP